MRIIKFEKEPYNKQTLRALDLAQILLDLRTLCSGYHEQYDIKPKSNVAIEIYDTLKQHGKVYLFNVTNFDPNLYKQCRDILARRSQKPAHIVYDCLERLETEQAIYLKKYLPVYPENPNIFFQIQIQETVRQVLNRIKNKNKKNNKNNNIRGGDKNATIEWE